MIVSHARRVIFFHNPKCAGTSFRNALAAYHDDEVIFGGCSTPRKFKNDIDHTHLRLWEIRAQFPRIWSCVASYESVIFVRDPRARFLSAVNEHMKKFQAQIGLAAMSVDERVAVVEEFVRNVLTIGRVTTDWRFIHFSPQSWYLKIGDDQIPRHVIPMGADDAFARRATSALGCRNCRSRGITIAG